MSRSAFSMGAAVLALAACSGLPQPVAEGGLAEVPQAWQSGALLQGDETKLWVEAFQDEQLLALIEEAQANNPGIAGLEAAVRRSRAFTNRARAELAPDILFTANGSAFESGGTQTEGGQFGLSVSWEPDVWGRLRASVDAAQSDRLQAEADERAARRALTGSVVDAYVRHPGGPSRGRLRTQL